jgi:hypothetical protein
MLPCRSLINYIMKKLLVLLVVIIQNLILVNGIFSQDDPTNNRGSNKEIAFYELRHVEDTFSKSIDYPSFNKHINSIGNYQIDTIWDPNPREIHKLGLNANFGGPTLFISASLDYFVAPNFNFETGIGLIGMYGGFKYHLMGNKAKNNWTPYIGLYMSAIPAINLGFGESSPALFGMYFPVGIQYLANKGLTYGFEIAYYALDNAGPNVYGALKVGYHFNEKGSKQEDAYIYLYHNKDGSLKSIDYPNSKKAIDSVGNYQLDTLWDTNPRIINRLGLNVNLGGPTMFLSLSLDYFVTRNLNIETGIGIFGYFGGIKYHLFRKKAKDNWNPYLGLYVNHFGETNSIYIPVGIQFVKNNGFTYGFELAARKFIIESRDIYRSGAIKFRYHF